MLTRVLLAVDDAALQRRLRRILALVPDVLTESAGPRREAWPQLARSSADVALIGRRLIPEPAVESVRGVRSLPDAPDLVVVVRREDADDRARLLAAGCRAVLDAQLSPPVLREVLEAILRRRRERDSMAPRQAGLEPRLSDFVTSSPAMNAFMELVRRVIASDASLLILGETGVGKEHLARAIHAEGPRSAGPFIAVNCGALPESLLESELFGHEEGAFTGATRSRRGHFELAHRGTLFLDEIGELPPHLQASLLQVLQRREIRRLGGEAAIGVDVRVMAATSRDIAEEVRSRRFRSDLYYRLGVVTLAIPPLRERREDVPALVEAYLENFRPHIRRNVRRIAPEALEALKGYAWPGNVRELVNLVERAMLLAAGEEIALADLPENVRGAGAPAEAQAAGVPAPLAAVPSLAEGMLGLPLRDVRRRAVAEVEQRYLALLLEKTRGRIGETARLAGIEPRSLFEKMRRYGLRKEDFRSERAS
jgi:DNA-binding NtrC family response regulator